MLKIVLTGPESTGKTTLARQLASHYGTCWVPEFARACLDQLNRPYEEADLMEIAKGQLALEDKLATKANRLLFCDTGLLVLKVWSEYKYGSCHPWILRQLRERRYDMFFLCGIDVPWQFDPQREHPGARQELFELYKKELQSLKLPFVELLGNEEERLAFAVKIIAEMEE